MATTATSNCVLYSIKSMSLLDDIEQPPPSQLRLLEQDTFNTNMMQPSSPPLEQQGSNSNNVVQLPPTPTASDDEEEQQQQQSILKEKSVKLQRRETVSLADLIPVASAALRAKHRQSMAAQSPTQDSALARALTKVKIGVQTHRLKERYLLKEWIRLALAAPVDESGINSVIKICKTNRTMEIVKWYEHKFKRATLSLEELEIRVDGLRRQKLLVQHQESTTNNSSFVSCSLPSPPATHLTFSKVA